MPCPIVSAKGDNLVADNDITDNNNTLLSSTHQSIIVPTMQYYEQYH